MNNESPTPITHLDPSRIQATTESGELERPRLFRRKIDCGGNPEITDRRATRGGGRRATDGPEFPPHERRI
jgi:hypothetical protein